MSRSFFLQILIYGLAAATLLIFLKFLDYGLFIRQIPFEVYVGIIALLFTAFGIWMGLKLTHPKEETSPKTTDTGLSINNLEGLLKSKGISHREFEVLRLISKGHSNKEIAEELFISISTVKSHTSSLFEKLDVRRRTQAIQRAKEIGIIG